VRADVRQRLRERGAVAAAGEADGAGSTEAAAAAEPERAGWAARPGAGTAAARAGPAAAEARQRGAAGREGPARRVPERLHRPARRRDHQRADGHRERGRAHARRHPQRERHGPEHGHRQQELRQPRERAAVVAEHDELGGDARRDRDWAEDARGAVAAQQLTRARGSSARPWEEPESALGGGRVWLRPLSKLPGCAQRALAARAYGPRP
jgi:hypothetical protein